MKRVRIINYFVLVMLLLFASQVFAVEVAPRISDREIIEGLADIRGDVKELRAEIKRLDEGQKAIQQQINDLKESTNARFDILPVDVWTLYYHFPSNFRFCPSHAVADA